jgi:hypothetical protein
MQVLNVVAVVTDPELGQLTLRIGDVAWLRGEGAEVEGREDDEVAAVLSVPASTSDERAQDALVDALQLVARAVVGIAASSGTFQVELRRRRSCVS